MNDTNTALVDAETVTMLRETGAFAEVMDLMTRSMSGGLDLLEHGIATQNREQVRRVAHRLCGAANQVGALRLGRAWREVEDGAFDLSIDELGSGHDRLCDLWTQTRRVLEVAA